MRAGRAGAVGGHHHPVAVGQQPGELVDEAAAVPDDGRPSRGRHRGHVGPFGRRGDGPRRGLGVGQELVEGQVQRREREALGPPGHGQRRGQVRLLGQDVGRPVAHAARVHQQHLGVGFEQVEQRVLPLGEPRQPRLHAVEGEPPAEALPLLAAPRLAADQCLGSLAHLLGGQQLAAGEQLHLGQVDGRALVGHRELRQAIDLVAPQVDAHGSVGGGREHVHDRAPHGHLAPVLDELLAPIAGRHQLGHQLGGIQHVAVADHDRLGVLHVGPEALHQGPHRRHHHPGRAPAALVGGGAPAVAQVPHGAQPPAHDLDAGAHPLERERLPGGEQVDLVRAQEGAEVVHQALGVGRRGHRHDDGLAAGEPGQPGHDDGPGRFGHGQHRAGRAQHLGQRRLVAHQLGEGAQRQRAIDDGGGGRGHEPRDRAAGGSDARPCRPIV